MELRKHYFLDEYTIVASDRAKRPHQFKHDDKKNHEKSEVDYFAPGNEEMTPPEIYRFPENAKGKDWKIRVFPNKFAFYKTEGNPKINTDNGFYTFSSAYGYHEVIVEHPKLEKQLWDLSETELKQVFKTYKLRIEELSKRENIKYVLVFKNSGKDAGTSIAHTHTQVAASAIIPPKITKKEIAVSKYQKDPFEEIISKEKNSDRRCFENDSIIAFTPYSSKFPMELWILPKKFKLNITEFDENEFDDLAEIMSKVLKQLSTINAPYNFYLHYGLDKLRFHIEVCPRLAKWAGYEHGSGIIINAISPEKAAKFYRGEPDEE
jgi:UDPglucose--hexose-1-phosphate uridylyltransferase